MHWGGWQRNQISEGELVHTFTSKLLIFLAAFHYFLPPLTDGNLDRRDALLVGRRIGLQMRGSERTFVCCICVCICVSICICTWAILSERRDALLVLEELDWW